MARPARKYDKSMASEILELRSRGVTVRDLCAFLEISERTLRRLYKKELEQGKSKANINITGRLYELCMEGNTTALIFWAKTQMGWREKPEELGTDIDALKTGIKSAFDSVGYGGQQCGVLVTPGILSEEEWLKAAKCGESQ